MLAPDEFFQRVGACMLFPKLCHKMQIGALQTVPSHSAYSTKCVAACDICEVQVSERAFMIHVAFAVVFSTWTILVEHKSVSA